MIYVHTTRITDLLHKHFHFRTCVQTPLTPVYLPMDEQ